MFESLHQIKRCFGYFESGVLTWQDLQIQHLHSLPSERWQWANTNSDVTHAESVIPTKGTKSIDCSPSLDKLDPVSRAGGNPPTNTATLPGPLHRQEVAKDSNSYI